MSKLNLDQLTDLYSLLSVEGIGPGKIRNLLSKFRSTDKILSADLNNLLNVEGISTNLAQRIQKINKQRSTIEDNVKSEIEKLDKFGGRIITVWDEEFPSLLKNIFDPPLILQIKGNLLEKDNYSIAMVGTRQPTNYGKLQAERFAADFATTRYNNRKWNGKRNRFNHTCCNTEKWRENYSSNWIRTRCDLSTRK